MSYRMLLLLGALAAGISANVLPASAYNEVNSYNLESTIIRGYVEYVDGQVVYILTDNGDEIAVQLGPVSFWNSDRYCLSEGEYVEMLVWYDPYDQYTDCYFAGEIWGPSYHFAVTNNEGVPYWVINADDYYYSLGYRASCVSFMLWYDCPPVYFIYLILPPPPPRTYICYYGPHWRTYHSEWHYGPRYCSGGSYWRDGDGYERHGRRSSGHAGYDSNRDGGNQRGTGGSTYAETYKRQASPVTPTPVKTSKNEMRKSTRKSQSADNRRIMSPQSKSRSRSAAPVFKSERSRVSAPKYVEPRRKYQPQSKVLPKQEISKSKAVHRVTRDNSMPRKQITYSAKIEKRAAAKHEGQSQSKLSARLPKRK